MPLQKNQILTLHIERLSSDGSGVAHSADGEAVFVPGTAPGDEARVRIVKDCGRYAFGILDELLTPSPDRIPVDCPVAGPCGGCSLRHLDYAAELRAKQESVADAFRRIGGLEVPVLDILPSPEVDRYRNKVQFPVGVDKNGVPCIGFYAGRTHRIVPCPDCKLQPGVLNEIGNALCAFFAQQGIRPYDEQSGKGLVRHIFLRRGAHSGQIMVCLVCTRAKLPHAEQLCTALREQFPAISTILLNVNAKNTNVILGSENHILYGPGYIEDTLCGVPVRLGPLSFYQVNTLAAERLYGVAAQYAQLTPDDALLDLYCGMGTIGLSMADQCRELIGVEIVPENVKYPQGAEKMQIKAITNREVKPGGLPSGVGCNVISTQTAYAIYRACYEGMPSIERVLTVAGSAMGDKSYNLQCRFGTPFSYIVEQCGGFVVEPKKIVLGGPMMGLIATNLEAPNIKGTAGILFFTDKEDRSVENPTCIHCGKCLTVCPMKLEPLYMYKYYQNRDFENMQKYHILDCFECGSCSYNCPGRLPLTHTFKTAKLLFAARAAEEKARAEAAAKEAETK